MELLSIKILPIIMLLLWLVSLFFFIFPFLWFSCMLFPFTSVAVSNLCLVLLLNTSVTDVIYFSFSFFCLHFGALWFYFPPFSPFAFSGYFAFVVICLCCSMIGHIFDVVTVSDLRVMFMLYLKNYSVSAVVVFFLYADLWFYIDYFDLLGDFYFPWYAFSVRNFFI